jgi:pimeloyl-ACP methyl ester carboxylesterase
MVDVCSAKVTESRWSFFTHLSGRPGRFIGPISPLGVERCVHGERLSRVEFLDFADDIVGCSIVEDAIEDPAQLESLDPPPCDITIAWSGEDRLFPIDVYGARARQLIPGARFLVLEGVGHVPMIDDPQLVADTIRGATRGISAGE